MPQDKILIVASFFVRRTMIVLALFEEAGWSKNEKHLKQTVHCILDDCFSSEQKLVMTPFLLGELLWSVVQTVVQAFFRVFCSQ